MIDPFHISLLVPNQVLLLLCQLLLLFEFEFFLTGLNSCFLKIVLQNIASNCVGYRFCAVSCSYSSKVDRILDIELSNIHLSLDFDVANSTIFRSFAGAEMIIH